MAHRIHLLPDTLANQIAAGEVIQRPASVVKELLENAIDAGGKHIKVIIKEAGKALIQVIDDGIGMSEVDARMSLEKHATSKISTVADLFNIQTMGFRGEALPSIAAVSQLVIETRTQDEELGTCIVAQGAVVKSQEPVAIDPGTKVSVKNLFFNVPARRNFLKSGPVETKHIIDEFQRAALAKPDFAFSLYQNGQETYQLPATDRLSHRIVHLFGDSYKKQLAPCQEATDLIQIRGYLGSPTYAKKTRGEQFFFVNKRFIKSAYLHHAVRRAFEGLLPPDTFPFYVLCIDIDPTYIDVNVHPAKTEIKFSDEHMVYAVLAAAIKQALSVHHIAPSLDFEQDVNFAPLRLPKSTNTNKLSSVADTSYTQLKSLGSSKANKQDWEKLFERLNEAPKLAPTQNLLSAIPPPPRENATTPLATSQETATKLQLHARYILAPVKSGLLLVDQSTAHERILYEKYQQALANEPGATQKLFFPHQITLNPADLVLLQEHEAAFRALGFVIEPFGKDSIIVSGCPTEATDHDPKQLLEGLIEQIKWNKKHLKLAIQENLARSLAKRSCIQPETKLDTAAMDTLVNQLFACQQAAYTPDGRKIWTIITLEELAGLLKT
ncbi:MAG: DNA mismatch repair endonuclease MutL [Bacteroidota bacterium]